MPDGGRVLTHCNAGGLACVGYGTALGVIRAAHEQGRRPSVWVDETRPVLQGARLTAWELDRLGIPFTLVADVMAGSLMASGDVDLVVVGADRIAANGDVANKIGTYGVAVLAHHHGIPFYVAAPTSTVDLATPNGGAIVVERRDPAEVLAISGVADRPGGNGAPRTGRSTSRRPRWWPATSPSPGCGRPPSCRRDPSCSKRVPGRDTGDLGCHTPSVGSIGCCCERPASSARWPSRPGPPSAASCARRLVPASPVVVPGVEVLTSVLRFDGAGRDLLLALKYRNRRGVVSVVASAMAAGVVHAAAGARPDVVTWAPTSTARRRDRGFDQAELLARAVARRLGCPARATLRRTSATHQTGLDARQRRDGPTFSARRRVTGRVLVVDDVVTTGATLGAAAVVLRAAGATGVIGVTAAATPLKVAGSGAEANYTDEVCRRDAPPMQVSELQVQRSLEALADPARRPVGSPHDLSGLPVGLVERLSGTPAIRHDRVEEARHHLETDGPPTAEALAQRMVGRLVCDRLR